MTSEPVIVVPYDPAWPARFESEAQRIQGALGAEAMAIEHGGSTAVPGLVAKPIIDILVGLATWPASPTAIAALVALGYEHRGDGNVPGREYFRRGVPRAYQVHACAHGGTLWREHVAFRDLLRREPATARDYSTLKHELALRFRDDRIAYTDAKAPFIRAVLARARTS